MNAAPVYVAVHVAEMPAQALVRLRPELTQAAVVVLAGEAPLEQVCSVNARARRLGVAAGMTRPALEGIEGLTLLQRSAAEEENARAALLEVASRFTPRIEVMAVPSVAETAFSMVLDMSGTTRMFGETVVAVQRIVSALRALRLSVRVAASANVRTALALAPYAGMDPVLAPAGREAELLAPLPLAALSPTTEQAETFALWGLRSVGELAALPEQQLIARMGQEGKRLRLLSRGEHPHLLRPIEEPFRLAERMEFDAPVEVLESLLFCLAPMIEQVVARAGARALAIASLTVTLGLEGGGTFERVIRPALPLMDRALLLKLVQLDLEAHQPGAGVLKLAIEAEPGDRSKVQIGLFAPQLPEAGRLDVTLARLAALVGEDRVGRARLLDQHGPERFAMERFTVEEERGRGVRKGAAVECTIRASGTRLGGRERFLVSGGETEPVSSEESVAHVARRRLRPAVPLNLQTEGATPRSFFWENRRYAVERAFGPWRMSGDWWTNEVWSCEEWDVRAVARSGEALLGVLTHDLLRRSWQMEALYD